MLTRLGQVLCWVICCSVMLGGQGTQAADEAPHITGMFSQVASVPEGGEGAGELYGTEIWIVDSFDGYWAVVQEFIDSAITPAVAMLTVEGNEISFVTPSTSGYSGCSYQGRVTEDGFDGIRTCTFANGEPTSDNVHLSRQQTYWQAN